MKRNLKQMCLCLLIAGVSGLFVSCDDYDPGDIVPTYRNLVVTYESNGGSAVEPCTVDEEAISLRYRHRLSSRDTSSMAGMPMKP